jgi:hypothetical protein
MKKKESALRVFESSRTHRNIVLNFMHSPQTEFGPYGGGFHEAARILAKEFLQYQSGFSDLEGPPIVYLYRHALELHLKGVVLAGNRLMQLDGGDGLEDDALWALLGSHRLSALLPHVRRVFRHVNWSDEINHGPIKTFADIRSVVHDLERVDPESFAFRYPTNKKGKASVGHHFSFSVRHFVSVMDPLIELLSGSVSALEQYWQDACEALSYDG